MNALKDASSDKGLDEEIAKHLGIVGPSPLQELTYEQLSATELASSWPSQVKLWCKRDDLLHPIISGNKWRKLQAILSKALLNKVKVCLSFGGAYSNHLHALAYACMKLDIKLIAVIRGERSPTPSPTIKDMESWGTQLHFVSRLEYKSRTQTSQLASYQKVFAPDLIIPEGGSHQDALWGMKGLVNEIHKQDLMFDRLYTPVASGATMAGLIEHGSVISKEIVGVACLKGQGYLEELVTGLLPFGSSNKTSLKWSIEHRYHFGGYAKSTLELQDFISSFIKATDIPLEPIYSAKCMFAIKQYVNSLSFADKTNIVFLHTGGLQGARSSESIKIS